LTFNKAEPGSESFDFTLSTSQFLHANQLLDLGRQCDAANNDDTMKEYTIVALHGQARTFTLPSLDPSAGKYRLVYRIAYRNVFQLCLDLNSKYLQGPKIRSAICIAAERQMPDEPPTLLEKLEPFLVTWDQQWRVSQLKKTITEFLEENAAGMRRVDKVIGIGLGRPGTHSLELKNGILTRDGDEHSYFQHLAMNHIVETLRRVQDNAAIKTYVQEPAYSLASKAILHRSFPDIVTLDDPKAFCEIDRHTIVVQCHMPFDAAEIALAMAGDDGLAGLICAPIAENHQATVAGTQISDHKDRSNRDIWYQLQRLCSTRKWQWKEQCAVQQLPGEDGWFGGKVGDDPGSAFYVRMDGP
tara:strand:+ start:32067 stop:33137 length:1071 start_codon:yes stop_codon:yes gene_type:complete